MTDHDSAKTRALEILPLVRKGSYLVCVNPDQVEWSVYVAKGPITSNHNSYSEIPIYHPFGDEEERPVNKPSPVTEELYKLVKSNNPFWCMFDGNEWDEGTTWKDWVVGATDVFCVFDNLEDLIAVVDVLRDEAQHYLDSIKPLRERFAVRAALLPIS